MPNPLDPAWLAAPLRPVPEALTLCAPGRLETTKGTGVLLAALARVRQSVPRAHLHLVGGGELARFRAVAADLGVTDAVTIHGHVPAAVVRDLLDGARIAVSPHLWEEPFGRVALEAGARGRALVASDRGGVRETTTPETAVLVPPRNPAALADAIVHLHRDEQRVRALGTAARRHVEARYAAPAIARQHLALYESLRSPLGRGGFTGLPR